MLDLTAYASTATVQQFMDDPITFFSESLTQMHSIGRADLEQLQREAMAIRFRQQIQNIEIVRKLADRLGVTEVSEFNDVVPLLFSHTAFKSYPATLIDNKRFDLMIKWLDKLTSHDLSQVDTDGCTSIDEWIDRLDEQTPLGGLRERARHLRDERYRRRRHRRREPSRRDDLRGDDASAGGHQHAAPVPEPGSLRPCRGVADDRRLGTG